MYRDMWEHLGMLEDATAKKIENRMETGVKGDALVIHVYLP